MRLRGNGITLSGTEGNSPPLPYIEVSDEEGESILARDPGLVVVFSEEAQAAAEPEPEPEAEAEAEAAKVAEGADTATEGPNAQDILEAIDLLDPAKDFNKDGTPKVVALSAVMDQSVTAEQVNAALATRESA